VAFLVFESKTASKQANKQRQQGNKQSKQAKGKKAIQCKERRRRIIMAPFRRGRSAAPLIPSSGGVEYDDDDDDDDHDVATSKERQAAWEARRRRKARQKVTSSSTNGNSNSNTNGKGNNGRKPLPTEDYDPYDSDPGESYREHCERIKGERSRSCLVMPRFLKEGGDGSNVLSRGLFGGKQAAVSPDTVATSPPSPLLSEFDETSSPAKGGRRYHDVSPSSTTALFAHHYPNGLPASLPRDLARVRYSLRTSIGDGSERQPALANPHLMERRELRPNNVHINVSHWSDFGGRNYMEDR
jgi:hypothetical protein